MIASVLRFLIKELYQKSDDLSRLWGFQEMTQEQVFERWSRDPVKASPLHILHYGKWLELQEIIRDLRELA